MMNLLHRIRNCPLRRVRVRYAAAGNGRRAAL